MTGKRKKYVKGFIDSISKLENKYADRMNDLRNNVVHGNLGMTIEVINISDFSALENLLYEMRFKNMGMDLLLIQKSICSIRDYNIYISDEIVPEEVVEAKGYAKVRGIISDRIRMKKIRVESSI